MMNYSVVKGVRSLFTLVCQDLDNKLYLSKEHKTFSKAESASRTDVLPLMTLKSYEKWHHQLIATLKDVLWHDL